MGEHVLQNFCSPPKSSKLKISGVKGIHCVAQHSERLSSWLRELRKGDEFGYDGYDSPEIRTEFLLKITTVVPAKIELILGTHTSNEVIHQGRRTSRHGSPIAPKTIFGWVLIGPVSAPIDSIVREKFLN